MFHCVGILVMVCYYALNHEISIILDVGVINSFIGQLLCVYTLFRAIVKHNFSTMHPRRT